MIRNRPKESTIARPFLTAEWSYVLLVNYAVPPELLAPHVPPGCELDTPDEEPDLHLLSMVVVRSSRTRVRGFPILTARTFPGVNLRGYARHGDRRGVIFLRQHVPAPLIVAGARLFYRQPYHLARIKYDVEVDDELIRADLRFSRRSHRGAIRVRALNAPETPGEETHAHFVKERYWGFEQDRHGKTFAFHVEHPVWHTYPVEEAGVRLNPGALLGGDWQDLDWAAAYHSIVFAEGSPASLYDPEPLVPA